MMPPDKAQARKVNRLKGCKKIEQISANTVPKQVVFVAWWKEGNNRDTQKKRWCGQRDEPGRKMCLYYNFENNIVSAKLGQKRWQQLIYMTLL